MNDSLAAAHVVNQSFDIPLHEAEASCHGSARVHKYHVRMETHGKGQHYTPELEGALGPCATE